MYKPKPQNMRAEVGAWIASGRKGPHPMVEAQYQQIRSRLFDELGQQPMPRYIEFLQLLHGELEGELEVLGVR